MSVMAASPHATDTIGFFASPPLRTSFASFRLRPRCRVPRESRDNSAHVAWFKSHLPTSPNRPKVALHSPFRIIRGFRSQNSIFRLLLNDWRSPIILPFVSSPLRVFAPLRERIPLLTTKGRQLIPPLRGLCALCGSNPSFPKRPKVAHHPAIVSQSPIPICVICGYVFARENPHLNDRRSPIIPPFASFAVQIPLLRLYSL